ncbi:tRNA: m1A22 methyltransferase [Spiroplasma clarkii]|uniref:tRNA (adenine(22)-N(1))-methyltransferase n=1 Tax=Spiroplasma clarkii TaxID=2139 RepID=UPI000B54E179|nr:class I SAM-dependent methyltransferase [Spiroplasma clarkii]ARU91457.1 tRNA: m1A22 methyltransferase [Spiroplasma clarkii]
MSIVTPRLFAIANLISDGEVVADIGTDHAYLPIYLAKSGHVTKVYATDIAKKPLQVAKNNIQSFAVSDKVQPVLADGIEWFKEKRIKISSCIIAGMGANTILEILKKDHEFIDCYVLAPNTDVEPLRRWVKKNKYYIETETLVLDNEIIYEIIKVNKFAGHKVKSKFDLFFGPILSKTKNNALLEQKLYLEEQKLSVY